MKLWLHIGTKKTGTTSLQHFMRANRSALRERGIVLPDSFGANEARGLVRMFRSSVEPDLESEPWRDFVKSLAEAREAGISAAIISAESLVDLTRLQVQSLARCLRGVVTEVGVILYVRRQDLVAVSHYSTALKGGGVPSKLYSERLGPTRRAILYGSLVNDWEEAFGAGSMVVRRFDTRLLVDGDLVADFCDLIGIDRTGLADSMPRRNESLSGGSAVFLRRLNELDRECGDALKPMRHRIVQALERSQSTALRLPKPARAEMERFLASFADQNEIVRARFFPNEPSLFDADMSMYPDVAGVPPEAIDFDEAMRLAYACLVAVGA